MTEMPRGGWLRRIQTGASAAFVDQEDDRGVADDGAPVRVTPRMRQVVAMMAGRLGLWLRPADIAAETAIPLGTVALLLARLDAANWTESRRVDGTHARQYRLTPAGAEGATHSPDT